LPGCSPSLNGRLGKTLSAEYAKPAPCLVAAMLEPKAENGALRAVICELKPPKPAVGR